MKNFEEIPWQKPGLFAETHWVRSIPVLQDTLFFRCDGVFVSEWQAAYSPANYRLPRTLYQLILEGEYECVEAETGKVRARYQSGDLLISRLSAGGGSRSRLITPTLRRIGVLVGVTPVHEQLSRMLFPGSGAILHPADPEPFRNAFEAIRAETAGAGDLERISAMLGALLQKIALLRPTAPQPGHSVESLLQPETEQEFRNVTALAAAAGLGARTLARRFRRELGTSPGRHLARTRLEKALNMLAIPDLEIKEIAQACGYSSANFLIRCFKKTYGITPGEYRRNPHPLPPQ